MNDIQVQRTVLNDFELTVRELGEGPTLLLLHGAGGAAGMFAGGAPAPFLTELAKSFRVLVPEHPGFGAQARPAWLDNIHDLAYFYLDYLEERGLGGVHLVGQSLGGWIALEMAVRNTSRLASLTVSGALGLKLKGAPPRGDLFLWTRQDFARNMFRNPEAAQAYLAREPQSPAELEAELRNNETLALLAWEPRMMDLHLHKWLHRIDVPTHVLWAEDDRLMPRPYGEAIAKLIGGEARFEVLPRTGHLMHADAPKAFGEAVSGFIRERAA